MHDSRGELTDRGQLLALQDALLRDVGIGDVLTDRDHVGDGLPILPHRDLADPVVFLLARDGDLDLDLANLSRGEDLVELLLELPHRLPGEHLEHRATDHLILAKTLGPGLPLPVPDLNPVLPIHYVEADRQAVDDQSDEPALLLDFLGAQGDFVGQVFGELDRGQERSQDIGHDRQKVFGFAGDGCREISSMPSRSPSCRIGMRSVPGPTSGSTAKERLVRGVPLSSGAVIARSVVAFGSAQPQEHRLGAESDPKLFSHGGEGFLGGKPRVEQLRDRADQLERSAR